VRYVPAGSLCTASAEQYFHVTASNGIVSNSPYTPLAIMTASPITSVRVFDPRCRCRLATFAALPTPSMIEPIIMLTDHPLLPLIVR
jgi:hypothetical protein